MENDSYEIAKDWARIKELVAITERDIELFTGPLKSKRASVRGRNNINEIRKICVELRAKILKQRQDNESDYY